MVVGFFAVNIVNLCSIEFQPSSGGSLYGMSGWNRRLSGIAMNPTLEPFKVAGDGLDELFSQARGRDHATVVTVLAPINYELGHFFLPRPSPYPGNHKLIQHRSSDISSPFPEYGVGERMLSPRVPDSEAPSAPTQKSAIVTSPVRKPKPTEQSSLSRTPAELDNLLKRIPISKLNDEDVVSLSLEGKIPGYALEKSLKDCTRAV
ncbi:hypothetical protein PENFLA_c025G02265 [Penicillium flavigenum]|uniref:Uncharacterized protein n=1 Tax=Penicillium flavigenum TaxID=254877 RepID=A0A1V6SSX8_9EURO|nr:hypothetical protein PENFLA_c025G02265 [Penicillium flavigenum]